MDFVSDYLVDAAEVAQILGVSRQGVARLAAEAADFPSPHAVLASGRIWNRNTVEAWATSHPDRGPRYKMPAISTVGEMPQRLWQIFRLAGDEARRLHHDWVGPDHLLLALLHPESPGAARQVLASFEVSLEQARHAFIDSLGDPFEGSSQEWATVPPATQLVLERANLKAVELRDEEVTSQHVLLALIDRWSDGSPAYLAPGLDVDALRQHVIAMTEETVDVPETPTAPQPLTSPERRIPRLPEPDLAMSPSGYDPRRRRPWGSAVFHDAQGLPVKQGIALRQYFVDRDGNPVLTADGRPIHFLIDDDGHHVLDEAGQPIVAPVEVPLGSAIKATPKG